MDVFDSCRRVNELLLAEKESMARDELIRLLDYHERENLRYSALVNHFIRETGLYPYLQVESSDWQERYLHEAFKVDVGDGMATLHREQSLLLKRLLNKENIAVSAPTSFGKSFVIDAFIAICKPKNVVILVPTIALTDETRRRLYKKFAGTYKIITTTDVQLAERNILIFPQERGISYANSIDSIDLLIVDEFYKASSNFDKDRSSTLLKAILKLGKKAKQKYFLAPNISVIGANVFTKDMVFEEMLGFHTVFLEKHDLYKDIRNDENLKNDQLLSILKRAKGKSLIYAGTYSSIDKVADLLISHSPIIKRHLPNIFSEWLARNYESNWKLVQLAKRGTGIHTGELHRSISQIQVRLFEEPDGFSNIVSTSSIIEGVNTSAENVIVWRNRLGKSKLNDFTYRNIIGRGGRMFKHFIGKIYLLEEPPSEEITQLDIPFPEEILSDIDEKEFKSSLTDEQVVKIVAHKEAMSELIGGEQYAYLLKNNLLQLNDADFIKTVATDMIKNSVEWNGLAFLNSSNTSHWDRLLYKLINFQPGNWDARYSTFVAFIKVLSLNWTRSIPEMLDDLEEADIGIELFFKLERNVAFKFATLASDVNELQKVIFNNGVDISSFVSKLSHAFLPPVVYQLEEYGLPRMISRKLHFKRLINLEDKDLTIHDAIRKFQEIGKVKVLDIELFDDFDKYIIEYFYSGITVNRDKGN